MVKSRIMIVVEDSTWTQAIIHLVCGISRSSKTEVLLLKMIPVRHPLLLGTEGGFLDFTAEDAQAMTEMAATAEDYGVSLNVQLFQYVNYWRGMVNAAAQFGVTAVIARVPPSPIPYWQQFRYWWLRRKLAHQQQLFLALEDLKPSIVWTPSITLQDNVARILEMNRS